MKTKIYLLLLVPFFVSCVKESLPECPYQYNIQLFVKDKNYFNVSSADKVSEDLPFNKYVSNYYYTLQNAETGQNVIEPQYIEPAADSETQSIVFDLLPDGKYTLTVWGNINKSRLSPQALHLNNEEGTDVYVASATLDIVTGVAKDLSLGLERVKGKLQVSVKNLPETLTKITESISFVHATVSPFLLYSDKINVKKTFLKENQSLSILTSNLAPTATDEKSKLILSLFDIQNNLVLETPSVELTVKRNEITMLEITYDATNNVWEIWSFLDNAWVLVNRLDIK